MKKEELMQIVEERIRNCQDCPLGLLRTNAVPGEGNLYTPIMFVGEAPGKKKTSKDVRLSERQDSCSQKSWNPLA